MGDFKKQGGFGGDRNSGYGGKPRFGGDRGGFGGRPGGNRDFGGPKQMFSAVCAKCGKTCEVPFRPNGEKPVYCNDCFGKNKGGRDFGSNSSGPSNYSAPVTRTSMDTSQMTDLRKQLNETNMKLDKILSIIAPKSKTSEEKSAPVAEKVASLSETVAKVVKKSTKKVASKKK